MNVSDLIRFIRKISAKTAVSKIKPDFRAQAVPVSANCA